MNECLGSSHWNKTIFFVRLIIFVGRKCELEEFSFLFDMPFASPSLFVSLIHCCIKWMSSTYKWKICFFWMNSFFIIFFFEWTWERHLNFILFYHA
jgi:hypothetical protein